MATAPTATSSEPAQPAFPSIVVLRSAPLVPLPEEEDCVELPLLADNAPSFAAAAPPPLLAPLSVPLVLGTVVVVVVVLPVELLLLLLLPLVLLTELPDDDDELPLLDAGNSVSLGVTTLAAPLKSHAVLAFFWFV